jgi:hypothetical protein
MRAKKILATLSALFFVFTIGCSSDKDTAETVNKNSNTLKSTTAEKIKSENVVTLTVEDVEVEYSGIAPLITARITPRETVEEKLKPLYSEDELSIKNMFETETLLEIGEEFQVKLSEDWLSFGSGQYLNEVEKTNLLTDMKFTVPNNVDSYIYKAEQYTTDLQTKIQEELNVLDIKDNFKVDNLLDNYDWTDEFVINPEKVYLITPKEITEETYSEAQYASSDFSLLMICKAEINTSKRELEGDVKEGSEKSAKGYLPVSVGVKFIKDGTTSLTLEPEVTVTSKYKGWNSLSQDGINFNTTLTPLSEDSKVSFTLEELLSDLELQYSITNLK